MGQFIKSLFVLIVTLSVWGVARSEDAVKTIGHLGGVVEWQKRNLYSIAYGMGGSDSDMIWTQTHDIYLSNDDDGHLKIPCWIEDSEVIVDYIIPDPLASDGTIFDHQESSVNLEP